MMRSSKSCGGAEKHAARPALDRETQMGPLTSKVHYDRVFEHLAKGKTQGAEALLEGKARHRPAFEHGYYMTPSLMTGAPENICCSEEIFDPARTSSGSRTKRRRCGLSIAFPTAWPTACGVLICRAPTAWLSN